MMDAEEFSNRDQLREMLEANTKIPARLVESLMSSDDREENADAYYCLSQRWERIQPEMEVWFTAPFVFDFLIRSITEPYENADFNSNAVSSYEAARNLLGILVGWFDHPQGETMIADLIKRVDSAFLDGDKSIRLCIETGFLEHALEYPQLRPLFAHWSDHPEMRDAHTHALEWGLAHEHTQ
jgi:hypothetical protein